MFCVMESYRVHRDFSLWENKVGNFMSPFFTGEKDGTDTQIFGLCIKTGLFFMVVHGIWFHRWIFCLSTVYY
jgi:hypothetical protein